MAELSIADRRGAALIARHGYAAAVAYKPYWLAGGHRIAKETVRRLLKSGKILKDPAHPNTRVLARGALTARGTTEEDLPPDAQSELGRAYWPEAQRRMGDAEAVDDGEPWAPPDLTDEYDRPLPVDRALEEDR